MGSAVPDLVLTKEIGDKGVLILNRPKARNALNVEMVHILTKAILNWQNTKSMIILKSDLKIKSKNNVINIFSAGGDVAGVAAATDRADTGRNLFRYGYTLDYLIACLRIPSIAIINGINYGGGVGLSIHAKYRIASEKTVFAMPETAIGYYPDSSASYFFPRLQGKLGYYLGLTGARLQGEDVWHAGIATHFCEDSKIPDLENALLNMKNSNDIERVLNDFCSRPKTRFSLAKYLNQIDKHFAASSIEGILNSLEQDGSEWAKQIGKILRKMSPTSLKVTLRVLDLGAKLTLGECFQMDYRVATNICQTHDFREGVDAMLITKHNNPKWNPPRIEDVTEEQVQSLFKPLSDDLPINVKLNSKL